MELEGRPGCTVRPLRESDLDAVMDLTEAVAAEGRWIGTEAGFDRAERTERFRRGIHDPATGSFVAVVLLSTGTDGPAAPGAAAVADEQVIGNLGVHLGATGVAELGMMVADGWRGRGVGSALMEAAVAWAEAAGSHKLTLQVWPHNHAARRLYERFGFVDEGVLRRHYRRRNGELWDAVVMGRVLDTTSPGGPAA